MIIGIGSDIIEVGRVLKACENPRFAKRIFTSREEELFVRNKKRMAGNFAVKEAVSKVFGTGFSSCEPRDVEVLRDETGKPYVNLYGKAYELAKGKGISVIHVTISDTNELVMATAIGEGG